MSSYGAVGMAKVVAGLSGQDCELLPQNRKQSDEEEVSVYSLLLWLVTAEACHMSLPHIYYLQHNVPHYLVLFILWLTYMSKV